MVNFIYKNHLFPSKFCTKNLTTFAFFAKNFQQSTKLAKVPAISNHQVRNRTHLGLHVLSFRILNYTVEHLPRPLGTHAKLLRHLPRPFNLYISWLGHLPRPFGTHAKWLGHLPHYKNAMGQLPHSNFITVQLPHSDFITVHLPHSTSAVIDD